MDRLFIRGLGAALALAGSLALAPSALAGDGTFPDSLASTVGAGANPSAVAIADYDSDGDQDLAITNPSADNVVMRLGNGSGGFTIGGARSVGDAPSRIEAGDFNSDGHEDFVVLNVGSAGEEVAVFRGAGDGTTFYEVGSFGSGDPSAVAVGHFNADRHQDLAITYRDGNLEVMLGDGAGAFAPGPLLGVGSNPASLGVGDFNEDGASDLAVSNLLSNSVTIRLGAGDGSFPSLGASTLTGFTRPHPLVVGDFNADGNDDLAVTNREANPGSIALRLGRGDGTFADGGTTPANSYGGGLAVGDFNSDEKEDIVSADTSDHVATTRFGDGAGGFSGAAAVPAGTFPREARIGDFDADGNQDLLFPNELADGYVTVRRGAGPRADTGSLLSNGGGEAARGSAASATHGVATPIPGWSTTGAFSNHRYGDGGYPSRLLAGRYAGQEAFFTIGAEAGTSTASQSVDVSGSAASIDAGLATARLSGYLGGFANSEDTMEASATFVDSSGNALGSIQIGPVTRADRNRRTILLRRAASGAVPADTRSIAVTLTGRRGASGPDDSAYADRMALFLDSPQPPAPPPDDPGPDPDTDAPETEIDKKPKKKTPKPKANLEFSSDEPDAGFECALAGKGVKKGLKKFKPCDDGDASYKKLKDGKKKFQVRAIDGAGNVDPTPARAKWKVT